MTPIRRRDFLGATGMGFASLGFRLPRGHLKWAFPDEQRSPTLVVIFLRGGMDGLNALVPYRDERYFAMRPTLAIPPEDSSEGPGVIPLDDEFGLHPALAALKPHWDAGRLAAIVNVGSPHTTRSHFDAQDFMEYAAPGLRTVRDGWLNRYLTRSRAERQRSPRSEGEGELRALAMQGLLPRSLRGKYAVLAVPERDVLADDQILDLFGPLYGDPTANPDMGMDARPEEHGAVVEAGRNTFATLKHFREIAGRGKGSSEVTYPRDGFATKLRDLSRVIQSGEGLEIAALDVTGWDTHAKQGGTDGTMANLLRSLAGGLSAFMNDLGPLLERTAILVMTEFGRTCRENGNYGTDHGHGSLMLLMGGGVEGGRVHGSWSGLDEGDLYQRRDLVVTTDFRDVFAEVLRNHLRFDLPKDYFPGYRAGRLRGLFS